MTTGQSRLNDAVVSGTSTSVTESAMKNRNQNLDLVRALAISIVLVFHTVQMLEVRSWPLRQLATAGSAGVDLFFVLSGVLIGGLYWRERSEFGNVERGRFILRRACRTIPPYLAALFLSWSAVYISRHEAFDTRYLIFAQNYCERIPYFLVSWSLCIEEHFYVLLPFVLAVFCLKNTRLTGAVLALVALLPLILRCAHYRDPMPEEFGFSTTATHLRCDGLILGVLAAYLLRYYKGRLKSLVRVKVPVYCATAIFVITKPHLPVAFSYTAGYSITYALMMLSVIICSMDRPYSVSTWRATNVIAITSYSIYLTHALVIHVCLQCCRLLSPVFLVVEWVVMIVAIVAVGFVFHLLVEKPSFWLRERLVPARVLSNANTPAEPIGSLAESLLPEAPLSAN
jgi:peptidoglycan/LPS O-acetylase OafA/YrhL